MDIAYNKVDQTALPISQDRVSASEYNQIAASLMNIITSAGLTPDSQDNAQLLNALGPRIVETYSNGTSWYRVYSDGWCEQGGQSNLANGTVTFLKPFANTNYNFALAHNATSTSHYEVGVEIDTYTATDFTFHQWEAGSVGYTGVFWWSARGYIA